MPRQTKAIHDIDVEGIPEIAEVGFMTVGAVVIGIDLDVLPFSLNPLPASENVSAGEHRSTKDNLGRWWTVVDGSNAFACAFVVHVTLQRESVTTVACPIHPEPALHRPPAIIVLVIG